MASHRRFLFICVSILIGLLSVQLSEYAYSRSFLYKSYAVIKDRGNDILCDAYTVKKNDYVLKLFKERGEISQRDFPEFLSIFSRINPHVPDINRILPGRQIYIPLKKLSKGMLPGQSTGTVTLPFVTVSKTYDLIKSHSEPYQIRKGDYVSGLISKEFGPYGSRLYKEGIKLFQMVNPEVTDINRIYRRQVVYLPQNTITQQPWYPRLFDSAGNIVQRLPNGFDSQTRFDRGKPIAASPARKKESPQTSYGKAAAILNAKLIDSGTYFFPRPGRDDFRLDLSDNPVLEMNNGRRYLCVEPDETNAVPDTDAIESFRNRMNICRLPGNPTVDQILDAIFKRIQLDATKQHVSVSDQGVNVDVTARWIIKKTSVKTGFHRYVCVTLIDNFDERTPDSLRNYLKHHRIEVQDTLRTPLAKKSPDSRQKNHPKGSSFRINCSDPKHMVVQLADTMGFTYTEKVPVTFPYAGIQIDALLDLISGSDGARVLIDYGNLYGDAAAFIRKTGVRLLQIMPDASPESVVEALLPVLGMSATRNPFWYAARRPAQYNTKITITGRLASNHKGRKTMITFAALNPDIRRFLNERHIDTIHIHYGNRQENP